MFSGVMIDGILNYLASKATKSQTGRRVLKNVFIAFIFAFMFHRYIIIINTSFNEFSFLAYGMHGAASNQQFSVYKSLKWLDSWEF